MMCFVYFDSHKSVELKKLGRPPELTHQSRGILIREVAKMFKVTGGTAEVQLFLKHFKYLGFMEEWLNAGKSWKIKTW